jgi:3-oxoacyl-[acyl-carrier protein] reductase
VALPTTAIDLTGRVALITGSGHGIGAETARLMAGLGASVVVNDIDAARAEETTASITDAGGRAVVTVGDVSTPDDVERMVGAARSAFDSPDILVNNAYYQCDKTFMEYTLDEWDRVYAVIVRGTYLCSRAVLPAMIERRRGAIVNVSSIAAFNVLARHPAYGSAKAAVAALTRDLASEVSEHGVRVNAIAPGPTDTKGYPIDPATMGILVGRLGQPSDQAQMIAFLASDAASFVVGQTIRVAGGSDLRIGHIWQRDL